MTDKQELVDKLAKGYSVQSEATNKFWLVLIVASIVSLIGRPAKDHTIDLPFALGKVGVSDFYSITIILISVVTIAFSSSMIQTIRTRMLVQKAIDDLNESELFIGKVHLQDFFDSVTTPTYSRVAPIAQFILGRNQFFGDHKPTLLMRKFAKGVYNVFKYSTFVFLYVIPVWALVECWSNKLVTTSNNTVQVPNFILVFLTCLAAVSILILLIGEVHHIIRVSKKIVG